MKTGTKPTEVTSKRGDSSKPISVYATKDEQNPITSSSAGICINIANFTLDFSLGLDDIGVSASVMNDNKTNCFAYRINLSEIKIGYDYSLAIHNGDTTNSYYTNVSANGWSIITVFMLVVGGQYSPSPSPAVN